MTRARLRRLALLGVGVLYAASIPWYRSGGDAPGWIAGVPDWVAVAVGCYAAAAVLNAAAWLLTEIPEEAPTEAAQEREDAA